MTAKNDGTAECANVRMVEPSVLIILPLFNKNAAFRIIIVSFICGLPWGAIGVAIGYVVGYCLMVYPCLWHAFRFSPVTVRMFSQAVYRPAAASVVMGFATWGFCQVAEALPGYLLVLLSFGVAIVAYAIVWLAIPGGRAILSELYSYISLLRPGAGGLAQPAK